MIDDILSIFNKFSWIETKPTGSNSEISLFHPPLHQHN